MWYVKEFTKISISCIVYAGGENFLLLFLVLLEIFNSQSLIKMDKYFITEKKQTKCINKHFGRCT